MAMAGGRRVTPSSTAASFSLAGCSSVEWKACAERRGTAGEAVRRERGGHGVDLGGQAAEHGHRGPVAGGDVHFGAASREGGA
ncbi:hypothetical protein, partial [Nonomuraea dietziae]|uniref:hypothetical protein n=1 Tax=Nonomuraea dietziae TaxID=65515 RepID=UPI0031CFA6BB